MKIRIDEDFYIDKDDFSFTLKESKHRYDKQGNEVCNVYGYFKTLAGALEKLRLTKTDLKFGKEETTLSEYLREARNQALIIADALSEVE